MILVDTNLLVYAHIAQFPQHTAARSWLDQQLNGSARVALPWQSLLGFLRIVTNPQIFPAALSSFDAWDQAKSWLESGPAWIPQPTEGHAEVLGELLAAPGIRGNLIPDAHLAALAIEHGLILCSADGDFARFPGPRWQNPLAA